MLSFAALVLWFLGLGLMLKGHMLIGACVACLAVYVSGKALDRKDDMETFFGAAGGLIILGGAVIAVVETWRWLT